VKENDDALARIFSVITFGQFEFRAKASFDANTGKVGAGNGRVK
jgi:hypothetical protein